MEYIFLFSKVYAMNWIEYWRELAFAVTAIGAWVGGRKSAAIKLKTEGADAIASLQSIYEKFIEHNSVMLQEVTNRLSNVEKHNRELQKNFNDMSLSYAVVVGESQKIEAKYNQLVKEYEKLRDDYEKLKIEFETYKQENKSE